MTVIHVSAGAAPGGDGSPSHPYASIQQAIDSAGAGDTIAVGPGTYTENIRFDSGGRDGAPLRLVSSGGPGAATITPADDALDTVDIAGADHIEISGFTLVGGSDATRQVVHVHGIDNGANFASDVVLADNVILRGAGDGIKGSKAEDLTLSGNTISGGGADTLRGAAGNDRIRGDAGQDNLAGEAGNDTLEGGAGNDTLNAGAGSDTLRGGAGADVFAFRLDTGFGAERIDDFSLSAGDQIAFAGFGAGLDGFGDLDSNRNGQLDDGDALVRVASGQTYIDLSRFYGHATGTDVIRITEDHLDSTDFRFLPG